MYLRAISHRNTSLYWTNLGVLYHIWDKKAKAVAAYKTALQIDQNNPSARVNLDKLLARNNE